jgi:hypothetical protein
MAAKGQTCREVSRHGVGRERLRTLVSELSADEKQELATFLESERDASDGDYRIWIEGLPDWLGILEGTKRSAAPVFLLCQC